MNRRIISLIFTLILLLPAQGRMTDKVTVPKDTVKIVDIEQVVVVATPKENVALRKQTLSSTSFSRQEMINRGISGIKDISAMVPNLYIPTYGSKLTTATYIRGIGSRVNTPAIGLYVDNIPFINKNAFDFNFSDIDRIDVLRGPQGTLYGRNTMGGLIRVYTRSPFDYQGTDLHIGAATYGDYKASVTHYHRISEKFAFSGGLFYDHQGGFYKNTYKNNEKVDNGNELGARLRAIYLPTDFTKIDFTLNYEHLKQGAYPYQQTGAVEDGKDLSNTNGVISYNDKSGYKRNLLNAGMNIEHQATNFIFSSVTGFQHLNDRMDMDQDYTVQDIFTLMQKQKGRTLSQDFVFKSKPASRWQWVTGLNGFYEWLNTQGPVNFLSGGISSLIESPVNNVFENLRAQNPRMPEMNLDVTDDWFLISGVFKTPTANTALYHQSTFNDFIVQGLSLTLGARIEYEKEWIDYHSAATLNFDFNLPGMAANPGMANMLNGLKGIQISPAFDGKLHKHEWQLLPKVALKYDFNAQNNIYASLSKGYRSGGYNIQMFSDLIQNRMSADMMAAIDEKSGGMVSQMMGGAQSSPQGYDVAATIGYEPETSWNYEIGTHLTNSNRTLQADVAAFYVKTENLQISRFASSGLGRLTTNKDEGNSYGVEAALRAQLTDAFNLNVNYGYTYATFKTLDPLTEATTKQYVPFVPKHTLSIGGQYIIALRQNSCLDDITLSANYTGAGKIYWNETNTAAQKFYGTLNGQIGFRKDRVNVDVWIHNALNKNYTAFYFESLGNGFRQKGNPLQIGIDLRCRF